MAACSCDYVDLPTNVALSSPGYVRLVNASGYGLQVATANLGVTASGTDTTLRFVVAEGGQVGIGIATPAYGLHLNLGFTMRLEGAPAASSTNYFSFGGNGAFGIDAPGVRNGRFLVADGGNVGIGTASPQQALDVAGTVRTTGILLGGNLRLSGAITDSSGTTTFVDQQGCRKCYYS